MWAWSGISSSKILFKQWAPNSNFFRALKGAPSLFLKLSNLLDNVDRLFSGINFISNEQHCYLAQNMLSAAKTPDNQTDSSLSLNSYEALELGDPYSHKIKVKDFPHLHGPLSSLPSNDPTALKECDLSLFDREEDPFLYDSKQAFLPTNAPIGQSNVVDDNFSKQTTLSEEEKKPDWRRKISQKYYHRMDFVPLTEYDNSSGQVKEEHWTKEKHNSAFLEHPGSGEQKGSCGVVRGVKVDPGGHKIYTGKDGIPSSRMLLYESCDTWTCPIDYKKVISRQVREAEERYNQVIDQYRRAGAFKDKKSFLNHWVFSPPQEEYPTEDSFMHDEEEYPLRFAPDGEREDKSKRSKTYIPKCYKRLDKWYRKISDLLKTESEAFWGGNIAFHPWREKHLDGSACEKDYCEEEHVWSWGPHFHYLGHAHFTSDQIKEIHERTGWVIHYIKPEEGKPRDFGATLYYILTHTGIMGKRWVVELDPEDDIKKYPGRKRQKPIEYQMKERCRQTYRWIGAFSTKNLNRSEELEELQEDEKIFEEGEDGELVESLKLKKELCPVCRSQIMFQPLEGYTEELDMIHPKHGGDPRPSVVPRCMNTIYKVKKESKRYWRDKYSSKASGRGG